MQYIFHNPTRAHVRLHHLPARAGVSHCGAVAYTVASLFSTCVLLHVAGYCRQLVFATLLVVNSINIIFATTTTTTLCDDDDHGGGK